MKMKIEPDICFYDTCSLLIGGESIFEKGDKFVISSITFKELEHIKTASNKDADTKYSARLLLHLFEKYPELWEVVIHSSTYEQVILDKNLDINNDSMILSDAIYYNDNVAKDRVVFVTNDLSLKVIANLFFGDGMITSIPEENDSYTGYKEILADDSLLAEFYSNPNKNTFNLLVNEYLILRDVNGKLIDVRKWDGKAYSYLIYKPFVSKWFGDVRPYEHDVYQQLFCDSLTNNKITMITGPAGSGKTYLSLAYLMSAMEKHTIDKIIVFCNTVATANSAKLGYYPGTKDEKLLDSQIGNLLMAKFGGRDGVEQLMMNGQLMLLPMSDLRGFDTNGMNAGIYISEAQNLDRNLLKLALQRVGEDCICIIDGDSKTQVDDIHFVGNNNGMKRASKVYRGEDIYGQIELKNIYRSKIASIAERM